MAKVRKILEIMALPFVLVMGHALTTLVLLVLVGAVATYLAWLIALNIEGPSVLKQTVLIRVRFLWNSAPLRRMLCFFC